MLFKQFKHINELNRQDGVHPWNYYIVLGFNDKERIITLKRITVPQAEEIVMDINTFMKQFVKQHMHYLVNPEALKECVEVKNYVIDRTLYLSRTEKFTHVFVEKYSTVNREMTFLYTLSFDYRDPTNTKHKYEIGLDNFIGDYNDSNKDIRKTRDLIVRKVKKCIKKFPEIGYLSPCEQEWLEKAIELELNYLVYEVLE